MTDPYLTIAGISLMIFVSYICWLDHREKMAKHLSKLPTIDIDTELTVDMPMGQKPDC